MGGGDGGALWKLKKAAKKLLMLRTCGSFCQQQQTHVSPVSQDSRNYSSSSLENQKRNTSRKNIISTEIAGQVISSTSPSSHKNLCPICLDPLNYTSGSRGAKAIFTAQCSHAFHFACITSNIQHGSLTCPICRANWTQLPRKQNNRCPLHDNNTYGPVLQIPDGSVSSSRLVRTRHLLRCDNPIEPEHTSTPPNLSFSLLPYPSIDSCLSPNSRAYLCVKLEHPPATDLVLVAYPNGPHLRLMKQAMALVVSSLRPIDRLAIVTCHSVGARAFRRMTSYGKRNALKIIDQLSYAAEADPLEGLDKGVKILGDRVHKNIQSCILHLTDTPSRSHNHWFDSELPVRIHRFDFGLCFGGCNGLVMREFEEFLAGTLGGRVEDIQLRIGERMMVVGIGELRGGEERNIPLCVGQSGRVGVKYSYRDGGDGECIRTGEVVVGMEDDDKEDGTDSRYDVPIWTRLSGAGNWDYDS
ncbi:hypothetical protein OROGR_007018 [Orobanche gracilis]